MKKKVREVTVTLRSVKERGSYSEVVPPPETIQSPTSSKIEFSTTKPIKSKSKFQLQVKCQKYHQINKQVKIDDRFQNFEFDYFFHVQKKPLKNHFNCETVQSKFQKKVGKDL